MITNNRQNAWRPLFVQHGSNFDFWWDTRVRGREMNEKIKRFAEELIFLDDTCYGNVPNDRSMHTMDGVDRNPLEWSLLKFAIFVTYPSLVDSSFWCLRFENIFFQK